ncbi:flagellar basal-body MS-ring/collar protein FliF [Lysobacter hankyongensis]|uniref:Flagellar M-ring protein n=1 Tax=Lysobacter hankyongensis TaxID=1176535 RepID=A0ABP9CCS9_9GAMM
MNPLKFYNALERGARIGFAVGVFAIVLITAGMLWWLLSPREQLMFGGLKETDAAEIVEALDEWKVPHTIVDGGTGIAVPEEVMYETRMRLVSAGIPRGGNVGFELFDDSDFGVTEFAQRVNYQRALQGEIERTIAALPAVESARVHLTIRRPGLFVGEQETSKASVAVGLRPGETLSRQQIRGIRSLVAAAVEGLSLQQVTVLDSTGALLAGSGGSPSGGQAMEAQDDSESQAELRIQSRISELLGQVLEDGEYRVSVDVDLDFDAVRQVNERPLGNDAVIARKRINSLADERDDAARSSNEDVEYLHGTVREEISRAPGKIKRMSVAVILPTSLGEGDVTRIESLIAAAAGIDEMRGDRLEVSRLGRGEGFSARRIEIDEAATAGESAPVRIGFDVAALPALPKILFFVVLGLLLGVIVAFAMQKKPAALSPTEREAVLGKMRAWLAEGNLAEGGTNEGSRPR